MSVFSLSEKKMKNLYPKSSKGKIHPSPSHSPSSSLSVLSILPSAVLTLVSVLSLEDQEVLAYLILRSTNTNPSSKKCKKPTFDCGCFDCYTRFWIRWDSSPNRELIHQAIEAFEDHLSHFELPKKTQKGKHKNRRAPTDKSVRDTVSGPVPEISATETSSSSSSNPIAATEIAQQHADELQDAISNRLQPVSSVQKQLPASNHRGLVRKVWPDVLGLFISRLWSLWSPNI